MARDESRTPAIPHWYSPDRELPTVVRGEGSRVFDDAGREYLDFASQLFCVNAGHGNGAIAEAIEEQLGRVQYVSSAHHNDARTRLAERLVEVAPDPLSSVFFAVSGSEANEAAVQIARERTGGRKVLTRWRSYHGATYGAGSLTGDPEARNAIERGAATTGATKFLPPVSYRSPFDADTPEELAERAAEHLEYVIRNEGPDSVAAVLTEIVGGATGAYTAPPGYFERVREICDEYDVLLIADEVITGFGRCGDWFAAEGEGVEPDMITFAKGVTSAYVPLAGVLVSDAIGEHVAEEGLSIGQTFAGHPLACAAGVAALDEYAGGMIENVRDLEPVLQRRLEGIEEAHEAVGDVRGRGFLWGVEFTDPETGEPFLHPWVEEGENPVSAVARAAEERGLLLGPGRPGHQVTVAPPLPTTEAEIEEGTGLLEAAIGAVFG